MQNPRVIPIKSHETQNQLLKSQRSILQMQKQAEDLTKAIHNETQAFFALVGKTASDMRVNVKKYTFDVEKLVFVPKK